MDSIPNAFLVIVAVVVVNLALIGIVCSWCCRQNGRRHNQFSDEDKARCVRLQIHSGSCSDVTDSESTLIFQVEEDQPPAYEPPPPYKILYHSLNVNSSTDCYYNRDPFF